MTVSNQLERLTEWRGTASELAETLQELLESFGMEADPAPTERLIRYYVTEGVLTRPDREGREARFGFRQIVEFLAVRILLADGWSLARIADFFHTAAMDALLSLLPHPTGGILQDAITQAPSAPARMESVVAPAPAPAVIAPAPSAKEPTAAEKLIQRFAAPYTRARSAPAAPPEVIAPPQAVRERAQAKQEVRTALTRLGIEADTPPRSMGVEFTVAPWCTIQIVPEALEEALRRAGSDIEREQLIEDAVRVFRAALADEISRRKR